MIKLFLLIPAVFLCMGGGFIERAAAGSSAGGPTVQTRHSITGFVYDTTRQPVADVYVELQTDFYSTLARAKTNGSGFFAFRGLPSGRYNVKVLPYSANYEEQARAVSLISVSTGRSTGGINEQVDFFLRVRKAVSERPAAAPGVIFAQEVPEEAAKHYEDGIRLLDDKKEAAAYESLKKALEVFPDYFQALDRLGNEYVMRGYYEPAYVLLTKAVEVNPKSFSSTFGLGLVMYRLDQTEKAIKLFQKAVEITGDSPNAHLWLGIARLQNKDLSRAEDALLKADRLRAGTAHQVHWQLARLYNEQKKYAPAADRLELFLKHNPQAEDAEKIRKMIAVLRRKTETAGK